MYQVQMHELLRKEGSWGEFTVIKRFEVMNKKSSPVTNASNVESLITNMSSLGISKHSTTSAVPCGFIVQYVTKKTVVHALCADSSIKKIENIDDFTSNKVKYMNDAYYELFPVLDGKGTEDDSFTNGAVLRYEKDARTWYADNNPPTKGTSVQEGTFYFIPEDKRVVEHVIDIIKKSTRKRSPIIVPILGLEWDLNPQLPANGLPYANQKRMGAILESMRKSNSIQHTVAIKWDGIGPLNKNIKNKNNTSVCEPIKESNNESNKRTAPTQLKIKEIDL